MKIADAIGTGLLAGFAGTAAMTVSSTVEARLRGRAASSAPARATAKVLGIKDFDSDLAAARFNDLSHWGYGISWGAVRGLLDLGRAAFDLLGRDRDRHRRVPSPRLRARHRLRVRGPRSARLTRSADERPA
jgi:hypothetical protein